MVQPMDYRATAAAMTDVQFELLLRARMRMEAQRVGGHSKLVHFNFRCEFSRAGELTASAWTACLDYGDDTKGERLSPVVSELIRRHTWGASGVASLLLVDGPAPTEVQS